MSDAPSPAETTSVETTPTETSAPTSPSRSPFGSPAAAPTSLWGPELRWTTIGSLVLVLLAAFEAMAVTTVMPIVAAELNGQALYAVAFSATLAASVIAMVAAGRWSDRSGPAGPLVAGVVVFLAGLVLAGTAVSMPVLVAGRFLQGLGGGAITVTLYVLIARLYPAFLQPRIFGLFSAAWIVPSMVGPYLAGVIAERSSWHWVFLGVACVAAPGLGFLVPALRSLRATSVVVGADDDAAHGAESVPADVVDATDANDDAAPPARPALPTPVALGLATVVALGVVGVGSLVEVVRGPIVWLAVAAVLALVVVALRPLLPAGTLLVARGLPATILVRGTLAAAYFGTEIYLPLMLQREHGLTPSRAGLVLTVGAISWSIGSAIQARLGLRAPSPRLVVIGSSLVALGVTIQLVSVLAGFGVWGALVGWFVGGAGMGLAMPRITMLVLAYAPVREQGAASAALSISDAVGASVITAIMGVLMVSVGGVEVGTIAYASCFALALAVGVATVLVARRTAQGGLAASA
ncbi:MFS transporter [Salana multivorans]